MADTARITLPMPLSRSALDRADELRTDPEILSRAWADPATRVLDVYADRLPYSGTADEAILRYRQPQAQDAERFALLLGRADEALLVAMLHPAEDDGDDQRGNLRKLAMGLSDADLAAANTAIGVANWHATQGFCPRCGEPTEVIRAGWARRCTLEGALHFPRTDPAVIMSVIDDDDRLLLARGPQWPQGRLSVLAGFVEPGESLEAAVAREVLEEVGVVVREVTYRGNQPWPFPASLMLAFSARASNTELRLDEAEIAEARWYTRDQVTDELSTGRLGLPGSLSVARHLIEDWYGGPIDEPLPIADPRAN